MALSFWLIQEKFVSNNLNPGSGIYVEKALP